MNRIEIYRKTFYVFNMVNLWEKDKREGSGKNMNTILKQILRNRRIEQRKIIVALVGKSLTERH